MVNRTFALHRIRGFVPALLLLSLLPGSISRVAAQNAPAMPPNSSVMGRASQTKTFDTAADAALLAMRKRAVDLNIGGVAVVAYAEGDTVQAWTSKMAVVGRMKDEPTAAGKGSNLLAIAYAKAAEMADTLKDSGSQVRPPLTGEFGWSGGLIVQGRSGHLIAAFSGGKSEDDLKVSQAGIEVLKTTL